MQDSLADKKEKLKYYESYIYNVPPFPIQSLLTLTLFKPIIADAVLRYENSQKTPEDQEKALEVFEYITFKKVYAQSCVDVISSFQNIPSTIKISDLLLCIENVLQSKIEAVEAHYVKYMAAPETFDNDKHEAILDEFELYFKRVAECMLRICTSYKGWDQCAVPLKLSHYMFFYSRTVEYDLLVHQLLRSLLVYLPQHQAVQGNMRSVTFCIAWYSSFSRLPRFYVHNQEISAQDFIKQISELKKEKSLASLIFRMLEASNFQRADKEYYLFIREQLIDVLNKDDFKKTTYRITTNFLWNMITRTGETRVNMNIKDALTEIAGIYQFLRFLRDESLSPEAIMSVFYTQKLIGGTFSFVVTSRGQSLAGLGEIPGWGIAESKKVLDLAKDPSFMMSIDFKFILDGLHSINGFHNLYYNIFQGLPNSDAELTHILKPILDLWFSPESGLISILLWRLRESRKLAESGDIDTTDAKKTPKSIFDSFEHKYFTNVFTLLQIIDGLQVQKATAIQANRMNILTKYNYVIPEMLKFLDEESFDALNSELDSNRMIYWSKLIYYSFKWRLMSQDIPGFCKSAISISEKIIDEKILRLADILKAAAGKIPDSEFTMLNIHSFTVTSIILIIGSSEFAETDLRDQLIKTLKIDEVLKYFSDLRSWVNPQGDELIYKIACYHYGFYFGICSFIQGSRLQRDNGDLILSIPQFEKLMELAVAFSHPNLRFPDVLTQLPIQITKIGKERASYLRSLHSSGFMQFLCKELYFSFDSTELVRVETQPDVDSYEELKFEQFKIYLYDQMIEDQNYDQVNTIISIYKDKLISNSKLLKDKLLKFQEIHDIEKYRCVSYFWIYCLDFKMFIQILDDLFEQSKTKNFAKDPNAQTLMKTLQESLLFILEIFSGLPLINRYPAITKFLINLLNHVSIENEMQCLMTIRSTLVSHLNAENHIPIARKYASTLNKTDSSKKEFRLSEFLIDILNGNTDSEGMLLYFELESLSSFFESIDFNLAQKLTNKIHDKALFAEDIQTLSDLWLRMLSNTVLYLLHENNLHKIIDSITQHYISYFNLCYDNSDNKLLAFLLINLQGQIQRSQKFDSKAYDDLLLKNVQKLFIATGLLTNYIYYYVKASDKLTNELVPVLRNILSKKGVFSSIMEAFAVIDRLHREILSRENTGSKSAQLPAYLMEIPYSNFEFISFFTLLLEKQVLKPNFISAVFADTSKQHKSLELSFYTELLEGSVHLAKVNPEIEDPTSQGVLSVLHQQSIDCFFKVEQEIINLVFFSASENPSRPEMIDFFYKNVFVSLLMLCKSISSADSRATCTALTKFSTLKEEALQIIYAEIDNYKVAFEVLASTETKALKELVQAEINLSADSKQVESQQSFSETLSSLVSHYNQISGILASNMEALIDRCSSLAEINILICNKLFDALKEFKIEDVHSFLTKRLSNTNYKSLCKFPVETISNSGSIFQKICKNDEPVKIQKAIDEFYHLCILLLKPGAKLDLFKPKTMENKCLVLLNLFAIFEHSSLKLEHFLENYDDILIKILKLGAISNKNAFCLLYLLTKTLSLDCHLKESMAMHIATLGLQRIDTESHSGDLEQNLLNIFYKEALDDLQKKILTQKQGRWSLSSSFSIKDAPYVDPDEFYLNQKGAKLFKYFLRTIEISASTQNHVTNLVGILCFLIPVYPRVVMILAKTPFQQLHHTVNRSILATQLKKPPSKALTPKKEISFLGALLKKFLDADEQSLLELFLNALVSPQTQSELILYENELIPTLTYHRQLLTDWLLRNFDRLEIAKSQPKNDTKFSVYTSILKLTFRDVHNFTPKDVKLYYKALEKYFDIIICMAAKVATANSSEFRLMMVLITSCLQNLRDMQVLFVSSEMLHIHSPTLIQHFNPEIIKRLMVFFFHKLNVKLILQPSTEEVKKIFEETKLDALPSKENRLSGSQISTASDSKYGVYSLSKLLFESKLSRGYYLGLSLNKDVEFYSFEKEVEFLLSRLPSELITTSVLKDEADEENKKIDADEEEYRKRLALSNQLLDKLKKISNFPMVSEELVYKSTPFAVDFKIEDIIPGSNAHQELIGLARDVNSRFRKFLEPILEKRFESNLLKRQILCNFSTEDLESEIQKFMNGLSKKEYIAFILCSDEETFNKQPKHIRTILQGLRERTKSLFSQKASYENVPTRSRTLITNLADKETKLEQLLTTDPSKSSLTEADLMSKLEHLLLGKLNYDITSILKPLLDNRDFKMIRLESVRLWKYSLQVFTLINEYCEKVGVNITPLSLKKLPPLPATLLEKTIAIYCMSPFSNYLYIECLKVLLYNPYDEVRLLDLMLHVLTVPNEKMMELLKFLEDYFYFKMKQNKAEVAKELKTTLSQTFTWIFGRRSRDVTFLASFKMLIEKVENELGVVPLKQKLLFANLTDFKYTEGRSFIQEWLSIASEVSGKTDGRGQAILPILIRYFTTVTDKPVEEGEDSFLQYYLALMEDPDYFIPTFYRFSDTHLFLAAKNPRIFEVILQHCNSSKLYTQKIEALTSFADDLSNYLKTLIVAKVPFTLKAIDAKALTESMDTMRYFTDMNLALIQYFQEVIERLGNPKSYNKEHKYSIFQCTKLLKSFIGHSRMKNLQSTLVGHLEKIEATLEFDAGGGCDTQCLRLINATCCFVITFYKIHKVQEELEYVASLGQEVHSPALVRIKSKIDPESIEQPLLRLDRTLSVAFKERPMNLDEIMLRLASKCSKLFKLYINFEENDHFTMSMVPWVIPQAVRLEFLRDKLQKNENSIVKKFYLRRDAILEDTLANFAALQPNEISHNLKLNIEFIGEAGVDQGGLTTEWISKLLKILVDPSSGLFHLSGNNISLQPSPASAIIPENQKYYRLLGRIIGYVIANRISVSVNFTKPMLKQLLGAPLNAFDLADVDPDLSNSLQWMLDNTLISEEFLQEFSFEFNFLDKFYTIDLNEDQPNQEVNEENKKLFVKQLIYHKLVKSIEAPLSEIYTGITEFVPSVYLKLLTPADLNSILVGERTINIAEMKKYAKVKQPSPSQEVIEWLWEILEEMEKDQLSAFLFFVTGNSVVGFGGFKEHPIVINRSYSPYGSLPSAHTCFSMIDLPEYPSKEFMKEKLLKAILEGQGFHLA